MAFENIYPNRKDWRKQYHMRPSIRIRKGDTIPRSGKPGAHDCGCRPGGSCDYCRGNRMHGDKKRELSAREQIHEAVNRVVNEAWIGGTPGDQGIMAARDDARRRAATIKQDLKVLGGLIEQISEWSNDVDYLSAAEQTKVQRLCMELGYATGEIARRHGV